MNTREVAVRELVVALRVFVLFVVDAEIPTGVSAEAMLLEVFVLLLGSGLMLTPRVPVVEDVPSLFDQSLGVVDCLLVQLDCHLFHFPSSVASGALPVTRARLRSSADQRPQGYVSGSDADPAAARCSGCSASVGSRERNASWRRPMSVGSEVPIRPRAGSYTTPIARCPHGSLNHGKLCAAGKTNNRSSPTEAWSSPSWLSGCAAGTGMTRVGAPQNSAAITLPRYPPNPASITPSRA